MGGGLGEGAGAVKDKSKGRRPKRGFLNQPPQAPARVGHPFATPRTRAGQLGAEAVAKHLGEAALVVVVPLSFCRQRRAGREEGAVT